MIKVNFEDTEWREGMTVETLLALKKYTYTKIIVKINGRLVEKDDYAAETINDGDDVRVVHLLAGG